MTGQSLSWPGQCNDGKSCVPVPPHWEERGEGEGRRRGRRGEEERERGEERGGGEGRRRGEEEERGGGERRRRGRKGRRKEEEREEERGGYEEDNTWFIVKFHLHWHKDYQWILLCCNSVHSTQ